MPFGNASFKRANVKYLSVEQTLADYAALVTSLIKRLNQTSTTPVVAFGGSYGGWLAAWCLS